MRKFLLTAAYLLMLFTQVWAQSRVITGTVTDARTNTPLQSVTVAVRGTTTSTQTNGEGNFAISAATGNVLVFSSVGFQSQEVTVGASSSVSISLQVQSNELNEVVVTALGVSREKGSVGYATTTIRTDEINRVSPVSMFDGLQGKIAGADISNLSGAPGGSTKVVLRGYTSIIGTNQPLFIIDGVPVSNVQPGNDRTATGTALSPDASLNKGSTTPGYDFGNTANDINPNDIESLTVLKGAAATSLYGSRGSNGVIIITTKKGKAGRLRVDVNSSAIFSQPTILPRLQKVFGQGWDGRFWASENGSWGPRLDGVERLWGSNPDNSSLIKPFSFIEDNVRNLYETGREFNNSVTLSGGTENSNFALSYGNVFSDGVVPTDNDSYRRNTFSLRGGTRYKNFSADASFNYINRSQKFVETGQSASGVGGSFYEQVLQIPVDIPIKDFRDYTNKFFNVDNYFTPFAENPYYPLYENGSRARSDRFYGNINLTYKLLPWVTIQAQQGFDVTNGISKTWRNKNAPTPGSWNAGANPESASRSASIGNVQEGAQKYWEYDSKVSVLVKRDINDDFTIDGFAGANLNERGSDVLYTYVEDLALPGFFDISNGIATPVASHYRLKQKIFGVYGSATVGFRNYLYLTATARNDWSSTLPKDNNSYFYPSANISFLLSNVLNVERSKLSYAKLRVSAGRTGKDAPAYLVFDRIISNTVLFPFGQLNFPFNGVPGYTLSDLIGNRQLEPELTQEYEVGGEFRFLNDRIGLDISYYNKLTEGQIINVPITPSTGFSSVTLNFGEVRNRGIEIAAQLVPVRTRNFTWDIGYTYTRNRNTVLELPENLTKVQFTAAYDAKLEARVGQPLGVIYAPGPRYDSIGRVIVDAATGFPVDDASEDQYYGAPQRDYVMGITNGFTFKNFRFGFSFDYRKGGVFYSSTAELLMFTGNNYVTTYNDRRPFVIPNSVNEVTDNTGKRTYVENTTPIDEAHIDDYWYANSNRAGIYQHRILDRTFLKLRDVTLTYALPASIARKISADKVSLSVIGRNLWVWLPKDNQIIDPEASNFGTELTSEFGEFRTGPTVRSLGVSLRVSF
jgi:TonB-linked SusC/RagA family outer membrane protein